MVQASDWDTSWVSSSANVMVVFGWEEIPGHTQNWLEGFYYPPWPEDTMGPHRISWIVSLERGTFWFPSWTCCLLELTAW